ELVPIGERRFMLAKIPIKLQVSFQEPSPGTHLLYLSTGQGNPLGLVYAGADAGKPTDLAPYAGTFQSNEADATVTTAVEAGKLVLRARNFEKAELAADPANLRGSFPLEPVCGDSFKNNWLGLLRFTRDVKGQISGFAVSNFAGGVRHLRFQKGHWQFVAD